MTGLKAQTNQLISLNREGRWGTTDDFTTSFLHFSPFPTAFWDLANSRPVHFLLLSSHLFFCLPCLLPPFTVLCKMGLVKEWTPFFSKPELLTMVYRGKGWSGDVAQLIERRTGTVLIQVRFPGEDAGSIPALSSPPFHCAFYQMVFTRPDEWETGPYH